MEQLTNAQNTLLQAIERLKRAMGMSPTVQELAVELGVKAPSVFEGLKRLEDKGYIRRQARKRVPSKSSTHKHRIKPI